MTKTKLHPIFKACCRRPGGKYAVDKPFRIGDYVYATDCRIVVRTQSPGNDPPFRTNAPVANKLDWSVPDAELVDLPDVGDGQVMCGLCRGKGKWGRHKCDDCDGAGSIPDANGVPVGPIMLGRGYIALLRRHGIKQVRPNAVMGTDPRYPALLPSCHFAGDGFKGILMGVARGAV